MSGADLHDGRRRKIVNCFACGKKIVSQYFMDEQGNIFCSILCKRSRVECGNKIGQPANDKADTSVAGFGVIKNAELYSDNVILNAARGHGFAAEKANHLFDQATGKTAEHLGPSNELNGADRRVNGVFIQTKYCNSGSKCIKECFDSAGKFRYMNVDGSPMQIEVPSDKYEAAVQAMEDRIRKGQIPGVSDPGQAKSIIREGSFTYDQARNIARFGTVESIAYDAANGAVVASSAFALSAVISFACAIWKGERTDEALRQSCYVFLVKRKSEKNRAKIRNSPFGNPKKIAGHFCLMRACFMR